MSRWWSMAGLTALATTALVAATTVVASAEPTTGPDDPGGDPPGIECLSDTRSTMSTSESNPKLATTITVSWTVTSPCSPTITIAGPGFASESIPKAGSRTVTMNSLGNASWSMRLAVAGSSKSGAGAGVTVQPRPVFPLIASARNLDGRLEVFKADAAGRAFHRAELTPGGAWSSWFPLPGSVRAVAAETNVDGRIELFGINTAGEMFHCAQLKPGSVGWGVWGKFEGLFLSVAVARNQNGKLEVFGTDFNDNPLHQVQNSAGSSTYTGWTAMGGLVRQVAAESNENGRLELFGVNAASQIFHRSQTGANGPDWNDWAIVDGGLRSVALARNQNGVLEAFGTNGGDQIFHTTQTAKNASTWNVWQGVGGELNSVAAETRADGQIDFLGVNSFGTSYYKTQTGPNAATWNEWQTFELAAGSVQSWHCIGPDCHDAVYLPQLRDGVRQVATSLTYVTGGSVALNDPAEHADGHVDYLYPNVVAFWRPFQVALLNDGTVYSWGDNHFGQLGDGTRESRDDPRPIPGLTGVTQVALGWDYALAVKADGSAWVWGGINRPNLDIPTPVPGLTGRFTAVAAGQSFGLFLRDDGSVWNWQHSPQFNHTLSAPPVGPPTMVTGLTGGVVQIAAGNMHALALFGDGALYAWGDNQYGQAGRHTTDHDRCRCVVNPQVVPELPHVTRIAADYFRSYAIAGDDHSVYTWGGESARPRTSPYGDGGSAAFGAPGSNTIPEDTVPTGVPTRVSLTNAVDISANYGQAAVVLADGTVSSVSTAVDSQGLPFFPLRLKVNGPVTLSGPVGTQLDATQAAASSVGDYGASGNALVLGTPTALVPDVRGETRAQAVLDLTAAGFAVGPDYDITVPDRSDSGRIVGQSHVPGGTAPIGTTVRLGIGRSTGGNQ
jgi:hypothetical protein